MLRYKTETRPGLVAFYDIRPGNGVGLFLQPRKPARGPLHYYPALIPVHFYTSLATWHNSLAQLLCLNIY